MVVDDDQDLQSLLESQLRKSGYRVVTAFSGEHALEIIAARGLPHAAIVDIYMPGMGGLEFCRRVQTFSDLPVIMLTAEKAADVIVKTIEQFAEDYITKPFNVRELEVRLGRLLKRVQTYDYSMAPLVRVDDRFSINFGQQYVRVDDKQKKLTPTESKLLHILRSNANRVVSLEFLVRRLWPREEVFEDTLRVHVHRLRTKISDKSSRKKYIITERGQGYRFVVDESTGDKSAGDASASDENIEMSEES